MAPPAYYADSRLKIRVVRQVDDAWYVLPDRSLFLRSLLTWLTIRISSGWDCLGDAAQIGIILVIVTVILALVCLYWRLKVQPNLQNGLSENRAPVNGYWEVTRRNPDRVSITIYRESREPRSLSNPQVAKTERRASRRRKGDDEAVQQEDTTSRAPMQLGVAGTSDIHLVPPPPPPPVLWTAAPPSIMTIPPTPPPPAFGPPTFLPLAPPPAPLHPYPHGFGPAAFGCAPDAPPPYFNHAAPQTFQGQAPGLGNVVSAQAQPTWALLQEPPIAAPMATPMVPAPPPPRPETPQQHNIDKTTQAAPPVDNPGTKRRWFSLGTRVPTPGHARTLSNSSTSTIARSTSPSPPASSVSPPRRSRERRHFRRRPTRHRPARQAPQPRQSPRNKAQSQHRHDSSSPSDSSADSSYLNTSADVVYDNHEPYPGFRHHARRSSYPERRRRQSTNRETRLVPSQSAPHQQRPAYSQGPMRPTSPDIQYPSPEPHRPRVSFTLPTDSDEETGSSAPTSRYQRRSITRSHRSQRESHGDNRDGRRAPPQQRREQAGLAGRIRGAFSRMRRALRGDD
jgi:hypothetical protein